MHILIGLALAFVGIMGGVDQGMDCDVHHPCRSTGRL